MTALPFKLAYPGLGSFVNGKLTSDAKIRPNRMAWKTRREMKCKGNMATMYVTREKGPRWGGVGGAAVEEKSGEGARVGIGAAKSVGHGGR
jgi:hypothetical protein